MTAGRGPSALRRAFTAVINSGAAGDDGVHSRSVMAANRFYVFSSVVSAPWVVIIALADPPQSLVPALTHVALLCVWVVCVDLNRRRRAVFSGILGLSALIAQFAYLSLMFSTQAGFSLPLLLIGALAFVFLTPRHWLTATLLTAVSIITLARIYVSSHYKTPTVDVSQTWMDWSAVGNMVMAVTMVTVLSLFNNQYFVLERERNDELLAEAEVAARTDALTEVLNRRGVAPLLAEVIRSGEFSLAIADLDRFKRINDRLGHSAGDVVLANVARTLVAAVGERGMVARWGGEEFLVVLPGIKLAGAVAVMEHARQAMEHEYNVETFVEPVTISVGVAHAQRHASREEVLRLADAKLYEAKASGRNIVVGTSLPARERRRR